MSQHETIFTALKASIVAENPSLVTAADIHFGGAETARNAAPPEILIVPTASETWEAPQQIGPQRYLPGAGTWEVSRMLWTVRAGWEVHFWGATRTDAEALRQAFLIACLDQLGDVLRPVSGVWTTDDEDAGDVVLGARYSLSCEVELSITDVPPADAVTPPGQAAQLGAEPFVHTGLLNEEVCCGA